MAVSCTVPDYSRAGFHLVPDSPRIVANFNVSWRFLRSHVQGAEAVDFDASGWELVNFPHGVDGVLGEIASGCTNYQGPATYRKVFTPPAELAGKRVTLHFDGILGKSSFWFNGTFLVDHHSGFLPAIVDVTELLRIGEPNVVTVLADNSDDPSFPPGKAQAQLDFSYFGGIYRNVYLVATHAVHVSNPNEVDLQAGGGIFAVTRSLDDGGATLAVKVHLSRDELPGSTALRPSAVAAHSVALRLLDDDGTQVATSSHNVELAGRKDASSSQELFVKAPRCWSPASPTLYRLEVRVLDSAGNMLDAVAQKIGIRTVEMNTTDGLVLNGVPYGRKLIGANRHQDFAQLGFALPDATHWRDVVKLQAAGLNIVRNAHYPQSPAFMDACDALGVFVIVNTPGWQFWNDDPVFEQRVYSDIRNMVRRDRNHASVLMWEPILNETRYPEHFARTAHEITHAEYPYAGAYTGADSIAQGAGHFDVQFNHPPGTGMAADVTDSWADREATGKVWLTREWGDNPDDWAAQNSPSRVAREWGEQAQLVQAQHYASPDYDFTSLDVLHRSPKFHLGGTLWHSFDHQRGYHPDPFYGGIMNSFRRPKYSYELFRAQGAEPSVFIAHQMDPFSSPDVTVYAQADSVRLYVNGEFFAEQPAGRAASPDGLGMPAPILKFKDAYSFMAVKKLVNHDRSKETSLRAEAIVGGKVVAEHCIDRAKRAETIHLELDTSGVCPVADGSSVVTVVASVRDSAGTVKRLNNGAIEFEVSGMGELLVPSDSPTQGRCSVRWGEAPVHLRLGSQAGTVRVIARYVPGGSHMPNAAVLEFDTMPSTELFLGDEAPAQAGCGKQARISDPDDPTTLKIRLEAAEKELNRLKNHEVEEQQTAFA